MLNSYRVEWTIQSRLYFTSLPDDTMKYRQEPNNNEHQSPVTFFLSPFSYSPLLQGGAALL